MFISPRAFDEPESATDPRAETTSQLMGRRPREEEEEAEWSVGAPEMD